jgi:hypothetical protein
MDPTHFPSTTETLRMIVRLLLASIGGWLDAMRAVALHRRISGVGSRIERMLVRFRAGRLWRVAGRGASVGAIRRRRIDTLPRRFGWLVQAGGHRAAGVGSQLQTLLAAPEMAELLAASPQAVRVLRPLCRALAVELPSVAAASRQVRKPSTRRRAPRPAPEPFRIPLPRGVLSWARREGFGKRA